MTSKARLHSLSPWEPLVQVMHHRLDALLTVFTFRSLLRSSLLCLVTLDGFTSALSVNRTLR
jgi:hypothetical protein